jgi:hypothetical protein
VPDGLLANARAALAQGDVLMAYDAATSALRAEPENLEAGFVAALASARAGAAERARVLSTELLSRIEIIADVPIWLREDAGALVARLAKDDALASEGKDRPRRLRQAADLYETIADKYGRFYSLNNAATHRLLAGSSEGPAPRRESTSTGNSNSH